MSRMYVFSSFILHSCCSNRKPLVAQIPNCKETSLMTKTLPDVPERGLIETVLLSWRGRAGTST
jgi:hypothetical protein